MKIRILIGFMVCLFVAQNYAFSDDVVCAENEVQETDAETGDSVCVCKQGYYKDESDNTCHQCQSGKTTEGTGAEGEGSCKWLFKYKNGDEYKTWDWPGEVDEGNIIVGSVHGL